MEPENPNGPRTVPSNPLQSPCLGSKSLYASFQKLGALIDTPNTGTLLLGTYRKHSHFLETPYENPGHEDLWSPMLKNPCPPEYSALRFCPFGQSGHTRADIRLIINILHRLIYQNPRSTGSRNFIINSRSLFGVYMIALLESLHRPSGLPKWQAAWQLSLRRVLAVLIFIIPALNIEQPPTPNSERSIKESPHIEDHILY